MNLDKTITLTSLITAFPGNNPLHLLGELQFAFVTFVLGENFESFEQWKSLLILLCGCREAMVTSYRDLYFKLVPVLYAQIEQLPQEFFAETENFISRSMTDFIQTSLEPEVSLQIRKRVQRLQ